MRTAAARRSLDALRLTLAAVLLTYVWRVQDLVPGLAALKVPTIATAAVVALLLVDGTAQRHLRLALRHRVGRLIPWLALVAAVSVVGSLNVGWSLNFFLRALLPALALALVVPAGVFVVDDSALFAAMQVVGAAVYCIVILLRFDVGADGRLGRLVFYDGNDIGMLLVCTLPLCAHFARHSARALTRALAFGAMVLFVITIAKTGSRGAFLGLLAVATYVLFRFRTIPPSVRLTVVGVTAALLLFAASTPYWAQMSTILHPTADYNWAGNDDMGRMSIWERGLQYAAERPLTGVGIASFNIAEGTISPLARRQEYGQGLKWSSPHNSFVQVLAELGVPGLALMLAILVGAYRTATRLARAAHRRGENGRRSGELAQAHAAALAGYVISGFFLSQAYAPYLYFVIGMIIGLDLTVRADWRDDDAAAELLPEMSTSDELTPAAAGVGLAATVGNSGG